jgi:uncharacterized LabA/DUF88 family protein
LTANENPGVPLAVLIDADNASPKIIKQLLDEIAKLGNPCVKRIYGDWTKPDLGPWKTNLLEHCIQPIQQFRYTSGKNATDSAMIIDAMDLLYTGPFEGFCIVSSDSDFTRLASRLRESGKRVYGFGETKTPASFTAACDRFVCTSAVKVPAASAAAAPGSKKKAEINVRDDARVIDLFRCAMEATPNEDGWVQLTAVANHITKHDSHFKPKKYGCKKFLDLVVAIGLFEIERELKHVLIREVRAQEAA